MIRCLVLCFLSAAIIATGARAEEFGACLHDVIRITQDCSNKKVQYTSLSRSPGSGFGSEFQAILSNRRLVWLKSEHRKWEYECQDYWSWSCYLTFGNCPDSVVSPTQIDDKAKYSNTTIQDPAAPISSTLSSDNYRKIEYFPRYYSNHKPYTLSVKQKFPVLYEALKKLGKVSNVSECNISHISVSNISGIATKHIFVLNRETIASTFALNKKTYGTLFIHSSVSPTTYEYPSNYVGLQIRTEDKKLEMTPVQWALMTNVTYLAEFTSQYMYHYKHLFVATDNCSYVPALRKLMSSSITIHSACDDSENWKNWTRSRSIDKYAHKPDSSKALTLLADTEMLRHAQEFIGLFESNLVRMIYLLRYPQNTHSHALATEGVLIKSKRRVSRTRYNLNSHMNDINYFDENLVF